MGNLFHGTYFFILLFNSPIYDSQAAQEYPLIGFFANSQLPSPSEFCSDFFCKMNKIFFNWSSICLKFFKHSFLSANFKLHALANSSIFSFKTPFVLVKSTVSTFFFKLAIICAI